MWDDPQESSALRQLLRAGSVENSDYDVESGLARHLAQLQAGAQMPAWAVQTTLQKSASWSLLAWLVPPLISAGVVGAWLALQPASPVPASLVPALPKAPTAAVSAPLTEPARTEAAITTTTTALIAPEPAVAVARVPEAGELHDHANVAARNVRAATRSNGARRGRATRLDDAASSYAAVAQSGRDSSAVGAGSASATASSTINDSAASKAAAVNAPVSPAAQEPVSARVEAVEEAKAKPGERRAKEDESAKEDEVSGARLEREMRMLAVAQRVLTEDPERSLRLCRQGESEFRGSMFSAERKQVALLALVQLGKVEQARREGIPFLRAFPNAPWSARLREALSTGKLPR